MRCLSILRDAWANRSRSKLASHIGEARHLFVSASISFGLLLVLSFAILRPIYVIPEKYHTNAATGTATQATTSLALVSSHNTAVVDVTPNNKNGTFASSSADKSASFNVTTNNYTGYSLSITGSDNNGNLTTTPADSSDPVRTISSISTIVSTADFSAATTASSTNYSNKWGYKPSKYVDTSTNNVINNTGENAVYLPAPTTTPTMLDKTTTANSTNNDPASASNYTIALGIRADFNTKPGTYTNTFNLVAISNPISYTINYDKNTTDTAVSNIPARQSSSTSETTITLASTVPTRTHYSFIGWCSTTTTSSNGIDSCAGTIYNPNGNGTNLTYGIDQTTENTTTLRAMWKIDTFTQRTYIRYENADGTWGSYSLADTKVVNYGSPYSWSTAATASHQAASVSSYTATENHDNYVSIYRNTFSCYIQSRDQNANGTYGGYVARANATLRYGQTCAWSANADAYFQAVGYSNTITSNISVSLDRNRNTYNCYIQSRDQDAAGNYGGYTARVNQNMLAGNTCAWSAGADAYFQAVGYSATITGNIGVSLDRNRNVYSCYIQSRNQNADGSYTGYTARVNQYMYAGATCAWSSGADAAWQAAGYSAEITSNIAASVDINRNAYNCYIQSRHQNADGSYTGYTPRVNDWRLYGATCSWSVGGDAAYQAASYAVTMTGNVGASVDINRNAYNCYIQSRHQNADGSYTGYTARVNDWRLYGATCSWSVGGDAAYQAASYSTTMTGNVGASIDINRNAYNCYIQSRHQYANGTYTDYTARVNDWRLYGATCSWGIGADATYQAASYSATITGNIGASLDINRQVYYLTVTGDSSYIAGTTGSGYYRAGDTASISATASSGNEFTGWSQTAGTAGAFGNAGAASTTFTLPSDNATVYASGKSSRVYIQNINLANCPTTRTLVYDMRDDQPYYIQRFDLTSFSMSTCWMTSNLNLAGGTVLNSTTSNLVSGYTYTLPASTGTTGFYDADTAQVYNSGLASSADGSPSCVNNGGCYSYYNHKAATAGGATQWSESGIEHPSDICPAGWRLPTNTEFLYLFWQLDNNVTWSPWYGIYGGRIYAGSFGNRNSQGYYWTNTRYNGNGYEYYAKIQDGGGASTTDYISGEYGMSVRCVAK